jgi:hypothetical protein
MLRPNVVIPAARRPRPLPLRWLWRLWTLPTNIIGHLAGVLASGGLPERVSGPAARAWLYRIRPGRGLDWVGGVTLGHAILYRPGLFDGRVGRFILAHELAHTRQHDWLGPAYLPLHILAQTTSALISVFSRTPAYSRVHDHNPLEQTFICLGASAYERLARGERIGAGPAAAARVIDGDALLAAFGV